MRIGSLTDAKIRKLTAKKSRYLVGDGGGLYIEVMTTGAKYWRLRIRGANETKITLGEYPIVGLLEARRKRDECKIAIDRGVTPKNINAPVPTFRSVALDWFGRQVEGVRGEKYARQLHAWMERYLFPALGGRPIADIKAPELLTLLRIIEEEGHATTAHKVKQIAGQIARYGVGTGVCERDFSIDLKGVLTPVNTKHNASLTDPADVARLLFAIDVYRGSIVVRSALQFSAYTFLRPGEVRSIEWREINLEKWEIRIPEEKMKMRRPHIVPLSSQVIAILEKLRPFTGHGRYLFPNAWKTNGTAPMGKYSITAALRSMGFDAEEMTAHGFRSLASTNLNEQGYPPDVIERQLAHVDKNGVRGAYNYAEYLPERRKMMQEWADWLDSLKSQTERTLPNWELKSLQNLAL
jgi:integrase